MRFALAILNLSRPSSPECEVANDSIRTRHPIGSEVSRSADSVRWSRMKERNDREGVIFTLAGRKLRAHRCGASPHRGECNLTIPARFDGNLFALAVSGMSVGKQRSRCCVIVISRVSSAAPICLICSSLLMIKTKHCIFSLRVISLTRP